MYVCVYVLSCNEVNLLNIVVVRSALGSEFIDALPGSIALQQIANYPPETYAVVRIHCGKLHIGIHVVVAVVVNVIAAA